MAGFRYTAEQREAVIAALPSDADADAAVATLEKAASDFLMHDRDRSRAKAAAIREKYGAVQSAVAAARDALKRLPGSDAFWPGIDRDAALKEFEDLEKRATELAEIGGVVGNVHAGKKKPFREILHDEAIHLWIRAGGNLAFSRSNGATGGPTIRFLQAALSPVLGNQASMPETLAKKIAKKREIIEAIAEDPKPDAECAKGSKRR